METTTFETTVVGGTIPVPSDVTLPDETRVIVTVSEISVPRSPRIRSPRLANPSDAGRFEHVVRKLSDAEV